MDFENFRKEIKIYCSKINIEIKIKELENLYQFMNLLIEKNKQINLTAIIEEKDIILKHFIDSIIIQNSIKDSNNIIDVGTGAGFPGIPLKIINEEKRFVLLDSLNKRVNFLNEVISSLNLKKVEAIHFRAEEAGQKEEYREKFDIVLSRAVSRLNTLAEYMLPFTKVGGKCICLKGPNMKEELEEAKNAIEILGGKIEKTEEYYLPESDIGRTIIVINKVKHLPNKYPRKAGVPSNRPL